MARETHRPSRPTKPQRANVRTVTVENVNHPGSGRTVDGPKYRAMRRAVLKVLPRLVPGLTLDETRSAVLSHLPASLFPAGAHSGWWFKTVQLDLEAKHLIARVKTTPLRIHRCR